MSKPTSPLAPLVFDDQRPINEQANQLPNKLVYIPVQESLLEQLNKLHELTQDELGAVLSPVLVATRLLNLHLSLAGKYIKLDLELARGGLDLIAFLETLRQVTVEIAFYQEQSQAAHAYLHQEGQAHE